MINIVADTKRSIQTTENYCGGYDVLLPPTTKPFRTSAMSVCSDLLCSSESHLELSFAQPAWLIVWFKGPNSANLGC